MNAHGQGIGFSVAAGSSFQPSQNRIGTGQPNYSPFVPPQSLQGNMPRTQGRVHSTPASQVGDMSWLIDIQSQLQQTDFGASIAEAQAIWMQHMHQPVSQQPMRMGIAMDSKLQGMVGQNTQTGLQARQAGTDSWGAEMRNLDPMSRVDKENLAANEPQWMPPLRTSKSVQVLDDQFPPAHGRTAEYMPWQESYGMQQGLGSGILQPDAFSGSSMNSTHQAFSMNSTLPANPLIAGVPQPRTAVPEVNPQQNPQSGFGLAELAMQMHIPPELLLDPERQKTMTAEEQRDVLQAMYDEQAR